MLAVGFGALAAIGALLRWQSVARWGRPATLAINVIGSFALGTLTHASPEVTTTLGVAGLGALTTVSGVAAHVAELAEHDRRHAFGYVAATVALGVGAAWVGFQLS